MFPHTFIITHGEDYSALEICTLHYGYFLLDTQLIIHAAATERRFKLYSAPLACPRQYEVK